MPASWAFALVPGSTSLPSLPRSRSSCSRRLFRRRRWCWRSRSSSLDDIDLVEINEAFASVILAWEKEHHPDMAKINVTGAPLPSAIPPTARRPPHGDPITEMERTRARDGLQTMCEGGGQANATIIERLGSTSNLDRRPLRVSDRLWAHVVCHERPGTRCPAERSLVPPTFGRKGESSHRPPHSIRPNALANLTIGGDGPDLSPHRSRGQNRVDSWPLLGIDSHEQ